MSWILVLGLLCGGLVAQTNQLDGFNFDDQFLDISEESEPLRNDFTEEKFEEDTIEEEQSSYQLELGLLNYFSYFKSRDDILFKDQDPFEFDGIKNYLVLKNNFEIVSGNNLIGFTFRNSLYQHTYRNQVEGELSKTKVGLHNELEEVFFSGYLVKSPVVFNLHLGKSVLSAGSSYLLNPVDYLNRQGRLDNAMGSYQIRFDLIHEWFDFKLAYLPSFKTIYEEFNTDKVNQGSEIGWFYASLGSELNTLQSKLIFFWNGEPHGGVDLNWSLGDSVILYTEQSVGYESLGEIEQDGQRDLPLGVRGALENTPTYIYNKKNFLRYSGSVGVSYTRKDYFTLLFEVYYAVDGTASWDEEKTKLSEVIRQRKRIASAGQALGSPELMALSQSYRGVVGAMLKDYNAFEHQPLFFMLRVFRDDFLDKYVSQDYNLASTLIYSTLDTSFIWRNEFSWVSEYFFTLGTKLDWSFGNEVGVLRQNPYELTLSTYIDFKF